MTRQRFPICLGMLLMACASSTSASAETPWKLPLEKFKVPVPMTDIVLAPDRNLWTLSQSAGLYRLNPRTGKVRWMRAGAGGGDGYHPQIAVDGRGRVAYAADTNRGLAIRRVTMNNRVSDARIKDHLVQDARQINRIIAGPNGDIWATAEIYSDDSYDSALIRVTPAGRASVHYTPLGLGYEYQPGAREYHPGETNYCSINDLTIGIDGNIWFTCDRGFGRITPRGRFLPFIDVSPDYKSVIARGADDAIYAGENATSNILRYGPDGQITRRPLVPDLHTKFPDLAPEYSAIIAAAGATWPIMGALNLIGSTRGGDVLTRVTADSLVPATLGFELPTFVETHTGEELGLDGRIYVTADWYSRVDGITLPKQYRANPSRGPARIASARRSRRRVLVRLRCVGQTGTYCTGKLRLRHRGRSAGRAVRYAIPAGPRAVRTLSARSLHVPRNARSGRLTVAGRRCCRTARR
jgi:streptogramin lyase